MQNKKSEHIQARYTPTYIYPTPISSGKERQLLELTGSDEQNPTFDLPCREVFSRGQKDITVIGPFPDLAEEAAKIHRGYWNNK